MKSGPNQWSAFEIIPFFDDRNLRRRGSERNAFRCSRTAVLSSLRPLFRSTLGGAAIAFVFLLFSHTYDFFVPNRLKISKTSILSEQNSEQTIEYLENGGRPDDTEGRSRRPTHRRCSHPRGVIFRTSFDPVRAPPSGKMANLL